MKKIILNLLVFQVGWVVSVLGGSFYAFLFAILAIYIHQQFVVEHISEWKFIITIMLIGCSWDITLAQTGFLIFPYPDFFGIPVWLICLWLFFAMTLQHSLRWLQAHCFLSVLFAAVFGPLSYWLGTQMSTAKMGDPLWLSFIVLAIGWSILLPCSMLLARKFRRGFQ